MRKLGLRLLQALAFAGASLLPRALSFESATITVLTVVWSFCCFAALVVASVASRRLPRVRQQTWWSSAALALAAASFLATLHFAMVLGETTIFYDAGQQRMVRGAEYTEAAAARHKDFGETDAQLLANFVGVANDVWTTASLDHAENRLALSGALLILVVGGLAFAALEASGFDDRVAIPFPKDAPKPLIEQRRARQFDVFLSHNSRDKAAVKEVGLRLIARGVLPWLDEWELRPGTPWGPALDKELRRVRSAAVFIGANGRGPWQELETYAMLNEFATRQAPVIPVLLPQLEGAIPEDIPLFLKGMTWVDMRKTDPDPIEQLLFGIRGEKPPP